jgi:hypothetical protein
MLNIRTTHACTQSHFPGRNRGGVPTGIRTRDRKQHPSRLRAPTRRLRSQQLIWPCASPAPQRPARERQARPTRSREHISQYSWYLRCWQRRLPRWQYIRFDGRRVQPSGAYFGAYYGWQCLWRRAASDEDVWAQDPARGRGGDGLDSCVLVCVSWLGGACRFSSSALSVCVCVWCCCNIMPVVRWRNIYIYIYILYAHTYVYV